MDFIYLDIIERLNSQQTLFNECNLPILRHFDVFKSQYIYPELHHLYKRPALFFEWSANWSDTARKIQEGSLTVRLHLEMENYGESFTGVKSGGSVVASKNRDYALQVLRMPNLINGILHGWGGELFTPLQRTRTEPDLNPTNSNVTVLTYSTSVVDDMALQIEERGWLKEPLDDMDTERVAHQKPPEPDRDYYNIG